MCKILTKYSRKRYWKKPWFAETYERALFFHILWANILIKIGAFWNSNWLFWNKNFKYRPFRNSFKSFSTSGLVSIQPYCHYKSGSVSTRLWETSKFDVFTTDLLYILIGKVKDKPSIKVVFRKRFWFSLLKYAYLDF